MRNIFFFFGTILLVDGVFGGDVTVSVMEGDSVTLKPDTEIPEDDTAQWWFGDKLIARINKAAGLFSTSDDVLDGIFKGKLNLDHQTGSLTITNTRTNHTGPYKLQIKTATAVTSKIFSVTVHNVVESLSVMEGDNVTLRTGVTGIQRDQILWKSGDQDLNGPDDTRWRNIHWNNETGEITIRNIQRNQSGDYKLEINTRSMILHRKLHIDISGEMKTESVKEGKDIILKTGRIEIKGSDLILWKFKDQLIAEIKSGTNGLIHDSDKRFKDRLQMNSQTGDLTISGSRITDTEVYHLNMSSSSHTVQRTIRVTVSDSGVSSGAIAGTVVGVLLLLLLLV